MLELLALDPDLFAWLPIDLLAEPGVRAERLAFAELALPLGEARFALGEARFVAFAAPDCCVLRLRLSAIAGVDFRSS